MTLNQLNHCDKEGFINSLGWIFEDSPWVAERTWAERPFPDTATLHRAMVKQVEQATSDEQIALLRAHPDLGARARMSAASQQEQSGAGLSQLTPDDIRCLADYRQRFGFPFLFAVKGSTKQQILESLKGRLDSSPEEELQEALRQVYRIAGFRLASQFSQISTQRAYYGKGDVLVYRLDRKANTVFAANVRMLVYGDTFWATYTTGDNTGLIATDSMKNFIQRETLHFDKENLEDYCRFIGEKFLNRYPQVDGVQITATEIPYAALSQDGAAFAPSGPERAFARMELNRSGTADSSSGLQGFKLLRLGGSAFFGFVRDEYTTLPDLHNRPLHMWLDLQWTPAQPIANQVRNLVHDVFLSFESGSIQQLIYQIGTRILAEHPDIAEVHLEANNRTWDTVIEHGAELGVYTDARPPYGLLALKLRR
jgi:urate oxidase